ncbi:MAG: efflux RND transporter permease subunit, partial [Candidatus Margulisbacteria bacterium]|nr:efflux RND transporter permease subunit [Candidatus Margulisiibacteriota bacterium]
VTGGVVRFRPVILTAITTILGLIPMSTGVSLDFSKRIFGVIPSLVMGSSSSEWWAPLANAVIFGLAIATVLTLVMVPVFYYILEGLPQRIWKTIRGG